MAAQQSEVQFLRTWQAGEKMPFSDLSGLTMAPDGTVFWLERDRGQMWRVAGDAASAVDLAGKEHAFEAKKTGGVAWLGPDRFAVVNTRNDLLAIVNLQGKPERVFASSGKGDGELDDPQGIAASPQRRIYVADEGNNRVAVFSEHGVFLQSFGISKDPNFALVKPHQVAVDAAERVYVLEQAGPGRITVYDRNGRQLRRLTPQSVPGSQEARWRALTADLAGRVFVADANNNNITVLDWEKGVALRKFGSPGRGRGQFSEIVALAIAGRDLAVADVGNKKIEFFRVPEAPAAVAAIDLLPSVRRTSVTALECGRVYSFIDGDLLCLDRDKNTVARLDATGKVKAAFPGKTERPRRAAFDARDIAIVEGDSVKIYGHDGTAKFTVGRGGSRDGEFDDIGGLHLADYIYVADTGNRRVQIFTRDGILVNKISDPPDAKPEQRRVARPVAVVTDAARNIYIGDNESHAVQVFSPNRQWRQTLGAGRYESIHGLAVDADNRLYVLAATDRARQVVDIYRSGGELEFSFAAYRAPKVESSREATLSIPLGGYDVVLHDADKKQLAIYHFLQPPQRLGALEVRGGPKRVEIAWRKSAERFVNAYRIYAATERDGQYTRIAESKEADLSFEVDPLKAFTHYRVSAVTRLDVEGEPTAPVEDLFRAAFRLFDGGKYDAALTGFERAAKSAPEHPAHIEYLGRTLLALGKHEAALARFQDLARRPGFETVGRQLEARALAAGGDILGARAVVERAVATNQADAVTYTLCADFSLMLADPAGAVRCADTALEREPTNAHARAMRGEALIKLGTVDKGLAELDAATAASPTDAELWRRSARVLQGLGKNPEALARYARVRELIPRDAEALLASAEIHLALGELDPARTIALSLVGSPAQESRGQYILGRIALKQEKADEAVIAFARATKLDAKNGPAWGGLAEAYLVLKDERKARDALAAAAALPDAGATVYRQLAELEIKGGRPAQAVAPLERAIVLLPGDYQLRLAQARTLATLDRWHDAANAAREATKLEPKSIEALLLGAEAAYRQGKNGEAIETLKRALALEPDSYDVNFKLGRSYADNGIFAEAQKHLERAGQLNDKVDAPYAALGQMLLTQRSYDAAIASLTKAVALNGSDANKRELDGAYDKKKRAASGTGGRIAMEDLRLERVFVSAHKQYATEPLGRVKVRNDSGEDLKNLKLSFFIKEYMDFPVTKEIPELKAKSSQELTLNATFNNKVLGIDEDTRVLVVATLAMADARDGSQEITQAMTLYGRNAIVWSNSDMIGSFVTPRDDTLRNFVREANNKYAGPSQNVLNRPLSQAATLFNTLSAFGLRYQPDPNTPFSRLSAEQVDYIQFPRETLKLKSGDCDDLSVLLAAGFENLGIESAFVEVPGHIFLMFNTGLKEVDRGLISLQDELFVIRNGDVWIPVEATLVSASFTEAWAEGARKYNEAAKAGKANVVSLRKAWEKYAPATLAPLAQGIDVPTGERVTRLIGREQSLLLARRLEREVMPYRRALAANPKDADARLQIGTIYARNGVNDVAQREFEAILSQEPRHVSALNNRGNLYFVSGDFERALDAYRTAEEVDPGDGGIRVNAALAYYRLGKLPEARTKFKEATQLNASLATQYGALAKLLGN
ncbi:MAG TPA: tetratricopeptide repeat protein [Burkholderiales bacterium]|nr:tetratricopeptide repeat protein [Burkholderiales bacterium]